LFAPTNEAFTLLGLLKDTLVEMIENVLLYHVASETVELEDGKIYEMLNGDMVMITVTASETKINGSAIAGSIPASNGIIYVIDVVIFLQPLPTEAPMPVPTPSPIETCPEVPPEPFGLESCEEYQDGLSCDFGKVPCCGNTGPAFICNCLEKEWRCVIPSPCPEDCSPMPVQPTEAPPPTPVPPTNVPPMQVSPTKAPPTPIPPIQSPPTPVPPTNVNPTPVPPT
jgi:hypothetical protein